MSNEQVQELPVRVYRSKNQFAVAAPLAGLEPEDIHVAIEGRKVTIDGKLRGPGQHLRDVVQADWTIGPYHREIELPEEVNGSLANATYGNGVLVLTIPKASVSPSPKPDGAEFTLEWVRLSRGERVGHMGHEIQPTTTKEHWARLREIPKRPAV